MEAAVQFAGGGAVRARRFGIKELGEQDGNLCASGGMVAAGNTGGPYLSQTFGTGAEALVLKSVKA